MGFPGDSDPRDEEEHECPRCGNILTVDGDSAECEECEHSCGDDGEPPEQDYSNYDGPTPFDNL
jgi:hypothetical protein